MPRLQISQKYHFLSKGKLLLGLFLSVPFLFFGQSWTTLTAAAGADESVKNWNFDALPAETLPTDFVIGTLVDRRPAGDWKVVETDRAKSPAHVLSVFMLK